MSFLHLLQIVKLKESLILAKNYGILLNWGNECLISKKFYVFCNKMKRVPLKNSI